MGSRLLLGSQVDCLTFVAGSASRIDHILASVVRVDCGYFVRAVESRTGSGHDAVADNSIQESY